MVFRTLCEKRDHVEILFFWAGPSQYSAAADSCPAHFSFTLSLSLSFFDPPAKSSMVVLRPAMLLTSSSLRELHGRIHARTQSQLYPSARTHAHARRSCPACASELASTPPIGGMDSFSSNGCMQPKEIFSFLLLCFAQQQQQQR